MPNYVTLPSTRKKKPDFWGGFAGALAAEVQRRAALKDAMDKLKAESDMALEKSKQLATFNQGIGDVQRQDVFDTAQFGQKLTPDVVGAVASPEEQYKFTGVIPSQLQGPPTPEAEATGIGGVMAQMRKRAAEMKQNVVQSPEDIAKQDAKREEQERKAESDRLTDVQRQAYAQANIRLRFQLREAAKGEGVDMKVIDKATAAYNARYNTAIAKWVKPDEASRLAQEAFDNVIDIYRSYGSTIPEKDTTGGDDGGDGTPTDSTGVATEDATTAEIDRLIAEWKSTTDPIRKEAIRKQYEALKAKKQRGQ